MTPEIGAALIGLAIFVGGCALWFYLSRKP